MKSEDGRFEGLQSFDPEKDDWAEALTEPASSKRRKAAAPEAKPSGFLSKAIINALFSSRLLPTGATSDLSSMFPSVAPSWVPDIISMPDPDMCKELYANLATPALATNVTSFFIYVLIRQHAYVERTYNPQSTPYSPDEMLAKYMWCNNYRELDRGTRYFRSQVLTLGNNRSLKEVLWRTILYRRANNVRSWLTFGGLPDLPSPDENVEKFVKKMKSKINKVKESNGTWFAACHIDSTGLNKYMVLIKWLLQRPKNEPSAPSNLDDLASDIEEILETADPATKLEQVCVRLRKMKGVGNFLSWQMTSDLLESGVLPGCTEEDWMEMGPGAISGLERIFLGKVSPKTRGALLEKRFDKNLWLDLVRLLRDIAGVVYTHLGVNFPHFRGRRLTLKNMEHVLCEFSKYCNCWDATTSSKVKAKTREWRPEENVGSMAWMDSSPVCDGCAKKSGKSEVGLSLCDTCVN
ncbi:hypothetical protein TeGR_g10587, partial [Tetraparma gracilis]